MKRIKTENEKYEKFMEGFTGKVYSSVNAEYKRTIKKTVKSNIKADDSLIFRVVLNSVLKGYDAKDDEYFFEGEQISTKGNVAYIYKFKKNEKLSYIYQSKKTGDYFIMSYDIEGTSRGYSLVSFTYETKIDHTITGFNGQQGSMKFKRQAKKVGLAVLEALKTKSLALKEKEAK